MKNINKMYLRNVKQIIQYSTKNVLISGNVNNLYCFKISTAKVIIHTQNFCYFKKIKNYTTYKIFFRLLINRSILKTSDVFIYFWPKSKSEVRFQLNYICSALFKHAKIFIFGEKNSGINCAMKLLKKWIQLKKIDFAKHCILYEGKLIDRPQFIYKDFIKCNKYNNISIKTIPSVFSYNKIDIGTKLLISTFNNIIKGKILDVGCGSGILSVFLAKISNNINLTLVDSNIAALKSSQLTLSSNGIKGRIVKSDIYSNINDHFDFIISNPPIHENLKISRIFIKKLITESVNYLSYRGKLRIVTITNLFIHKVFTHTFKKYKIIKENNFFRVYQASFKDILNKKL